jgi:hypothetical protein
VAVAIATICTVFSQQDPILNGNRRQITAADAEEGHSRFASRIWDDPEPGSILACLEQKDLGLVQETLPTGRTNCVAEQRAVGTPLQTVCTRFLLSRPPGGQIGKVPDTVVHNGIAADRRTGDRVSARLQQREEPGEARYIEKELLPEDWRPSIHNVLAQPASFWQKTALFTMEELSNAG